jgi:hypothetical protein
LTYFVLFPRNLNSKEAIFARQFAEKAADQVDISFDRTVKDMSSIDDRPQ